MTPYAWRDAPVADFAVIGDPVAHSLSPQMHDAAYKALGVAYTYVAIRVPAGEVAAALDRLREIGYRGVNVTVPNKEEAVGWCAHVGDFVQQVQAVNTIDVRRHSGINTDANGFLATLAGVPKGTALMLGAGGSARALARALVRDGWTLRIWNRTPEKAAELARLTGAAIADAPDPKGRVARPQHDLRLPDRRVPARALGRRRSDRRRLRPRLRRLAVPQGGPGAGTEDDERPADARRAGGALAGVVARRARAARGDARGGRGGRTHRRQRAGVILSPTPSNVAAAGEALRRGELVGMPTETVYGLAASVWDVDALRRTFVAKGRPADNPLIVHVAHLEQLDELVAAWPEDARRLAERFWPGPLTLVLPKRAAVPAEATGGLDTVAVRVPAHPGRPAPDRRRRNAPHRAERERLHGPLADARRARRPP